MSTSHWTPVCTQSEIPALGARRVRRPDGVDIALFRTASDRIYALLDRCPHKGGPLSQGIVFGESVACPLHNWTIRLDDGRAQAPDEGCTPAFAVKVEGEQVYLRSDQLHASITEMHAAHCDGAACASAD
ncbi:Assimilatory nitrite reductase (NAD(P)H) small subunit [Thiomonas arsenitoxydans]|jgi:nitrite reductase (NADH) small subunit|uniref:Assimilatory nitrite reductase (NAD(P)H) small subunit n=1 Tax=Thiomonas arsenitoxydans (strain DSM 22701 / CIP 110005 / 3As) TaxID=426114 RepID=D6CNQ2_THIA3|nr:MULTISPECIES: nitrite reductase small subunit NirD [Thiomonas]CAZ90180.1 Assimilatory nitrite reductase [NAD(P)H] small subunit [Thiomonas arsenitoxydans]CQR30904.1 Assimilatory nitrite reductase (NAD(P)H) small subunit [Thiomonas arsenitoxydans]CQR36479.1 Assimilatory nitrite reductase (NAD(P)H) small subunit [Thiomonas arsenitoxydans]CQR40717.1 Assimilatory nitrite reductase (NAD(P)H) small subunit [Thiomonas arsenitoxydans]CQR40744.1 Assimilatory nitrite reductase (NAD(P)H) small subunit